MEQREHTVRAGDGRELHFYEAGDLDGPVVFEMHGTPGCGLLTERTIEDAFHRGLRLISHDRPGYAASARLPGRHVGHVAGDVAAIADQLGVARFGVSGVSGGGPHALACAALLPDRVVACAAIASPAPYDAEELDWAEGMVGMNSVEIEILAQGADAHIAWLREQADAMLAGGPEDLQAGLETMLSDVDRAALTEELAADLFASFSRGLEPGVEGWHDESVASFAPWDADLGSISVPVRVRHGEQDRFVPVSHGHWLAARIPGVDARFSPEHGHVSLIEASVPEVHAWMAEMLA
jgi:pimeloyl-ACP methyl ester carboxylesterase